MRPATRPAPPFLLAALLVATSVGLPAAAQSEFSPFEPGPPPEMAKIRFLAGEWRLTPYFGNPATPDAGTWSPGLPVTVDIEPKLDGAFLRSGEFAIQFPSSGSWAMWLTFSYDRFRRLYRAGGFDDQWGLFDVFEGDFDEAGRLVLDNERVGTSGPGGPAGEERAVRMVIEPGAGGFQLFWESRSPGTGPWVRLLRWDFVPVGEHEGPAEEG